jgi:hypothetical protein
MPECPEQTGVDGAEPVDRDAEDTLRFLALPGIGIHPARHPEHLVSFLAVIGHVGHPSGAWAGLALTQAYVYSMTPPVS